MEHKPYYMSETITWQDFAKIEMRVGTIVKVADFSEARTPAYQLHVDFGEEIGIKKSSAQITGRYQKEELLNRQVVAVINFPKKQIANFMSECLILGAVDEPDVVLLCPESTVVNGLKVS